MPKIYLLFISLISQVWLVQAQKLEIPDSLFLHPLIDSLLIDRDISNYSIRGFTSFKNQHFKLTNDNNQISFIPNNPIGVGFGFANQKLLVDIAFNLKFKEKEPTDRFDLRASFKHKHSFFDYFLQRYQGFNVHTANETLDFRPDILSISSGLNYMYIINDKDYALGALRSVITDKSKTAYSFGIGGFGLILKHAADSALFTTSIDSDPSNASIHSIYGLGLGPLLGINGFFSMGHNFYSSLSLSTGVGLMYKEIAYDSSIYTPKDLMLLQVKATGVIGYFYKKIYINFNIGLDYFGTQLYVNSRELINLSQAKLAFGYRFFQD